MEEGSAVHSVVWDVLCWHLTRVVGGRSRNVLISRTTSGTDDGAIPPVPSSMTQDCASPTFRRAVRCCGTFQGMAFVLRPAWESATRFSETGFSSGSTISSTSCSMKHSPFTKVSYGKNQNALFQDITFRSAVVAWENASVIGVVVSLI
jgi:hypothetical protein